MKTFWKAFIFISAPLTGFLLPPLVVGLLSTGPSSVLVPLEAWILLSSALVLSLFTAFLWSRYIYPKLHHRLEESYQARWEKGELMTISALIVSASVLGLLYRPCLFTAEPYCRGIVPAIDILVQTVSKTGLEFTPVDQRASALVGSYIGFVVTFTILLDELAARVLFYWNHSNQ